MSTPASIPPSKTVSSSGRQCSQCQQSLSADEYSSVQWKKSSQMRCCKKCVEKKGNGENNENKTTQPQTTQKKNETSNNNNKAVKSSSAPSTVAPTSCIACSARFTPSSKVHQCAACKQSMCHKLICMKKHKNEQAASCYTEKNWLERPTEQIEQNDVLTESEMKSEWMRILGALKTQNARLEEPIRKTFELAAVGNLVQVLPVMFPLSAACPWWSVGATDFNLSVYDALQEFWILLKAVQTLYRQLVQQFVAQQTFKMMDEYNNTQTPTSEAIREMTASFKPSRESSYKYWEPNGYDFSDEPILHKMCTYFIYYFKHCKIPFPPTLRHAPQRLQLESSYGQLPLPVQHTGPYPHGRSVVYIRHCVGGSLLPVAMDFVTATATSVFEQLPYCSSDGTEPLAVAVIDGVVNENAVLCIGRGVGNAFHSSGALPTPILVGHISSGVVPGAVGSFRSAVQMYRQAIVNEISYPISSELEEAYHNQFNLIEQLEKLKIKEAIPEQNQQTFIRLPTTHIEQQLLILSTLNEMTVSAAAGDEESKLLIEQIESTLSDGQTIEDVKSEIWNEIQQMKNDIEQQHQQHAAIVERTNMHQASKNKGAHLSSSSTVSSSTVASLSPSTATSSTAVSSTVVTSTSAAAGNFLIPSSSAAVIPPYLIKHLNNLKLSTSACRSKFSVVGKLLKAMMCTPQFRQQLKSCTHSGSHTTYHITGQQPLTIVKPHGTDAHIQQSTMKQLNERFQSLFVSMCAPFAGRP